MSKEFKCLYVEEKDGVFERSIIKKYINDLPEGEVLIKVKYSSLNYKDALSATGNKGVTRNYPHIPGIDAAGIVVESSNESFKAGDKVIVTGYDLGMNTWGGFSEYIRVPANWIVKLPQGLELKESMYYGTAGFTAALSVYKLIQTINTDSGDILVTGGTGGVANIAIKILVKLGYSVVVATGKLEEQKDILLSLGIKEVISREEINDKSGRPLLRPKWSGVIDTVGGNILSTAIKTTKYCGAISTCGNAAGDIFESSVYPFILKGITLYGIDSVECPMELRNRLWELLAGEWKANNLENMINIISLEGLDENINLILNSRHIGRTIIDFSL